MCKNPLKAELEVSSIATAESWVVEYQSHNKGRAHFKIFQKRSDCHKKYGQFARAPCWKLFLYIKLWKATFLTKKTIKLFPKWYFTAQEAFTCSIGASDHNVSWGWWRNRFKDSFVKHHMHPNMHSSALRQTDAPKWALEKYNRLEAVCLQNLPNALDLFIHGVNVSKVSM